jgi:hypothetical protein
MEKILSRAILATLFMSMVLISVSRVSSDEDFPGFIRFGGTVTSVGDGYFMISVQKIELMNITYQGKRYETTVLSIKGAQISAGEICKGDVVVVLGQKMPNGSIMAHNIRLQPHE